MSAVEEPTESSVALEDDPEFELSYLYDRKDQPSEVTVFPASNEFDISTNWITVPVDWAIPIEETR